MICSLILETRFVLMGPATKPETIFLGMVSRYKVKSNTSRYRVKFEYYLIYLNSTLKWNIEKNK